MVTLFHPYLPGVAITIAAAHVDAWTAAGWLNNAPPENYQDHAPVQAVAVPGGGYELRGTFDNGETAKWSPVDVGAVTNTALSVRSRIVALCGDSITDGAGSTNVTVNAFRAYLPKILGSARINIAEHGVPGESSSGLLTRMPAIIAERPGLIVIMIGTNPASTLERYKSDVTAILDMAKDARIPVVLCTAPPRGVSTDSNTARTVTQNLWIKYIARQRTIPVADVFNAMVNPATGNMYPEHDQDGTHPTPAGHLVIAKTIAAVVTKILPEAVPIVSNPGAPGLIANPLMAGGTASSSPTGWGLSASVTAGYTAQGSTVDPTPGDGLTGGQWFRLAIDGSGVTGTGNGTVVRHHTFSTNPNAGDVLLITAQVKTDPGIPGSASVHLLDGTTILAGIGESFGVENPGMIRRIYTVPAAGFTSSGRIRVGTSTPAGSAHAAYYGAVQVYNLTQLGLSEIGNS